MKKGILSIVLALTGATIVVGTVEKTSSKALKKMKEMSDKHLALFLMMNQWMKVKNQGKNLTDYFEEKGYKNLAIYGMSYVGETLLNELKNTKVQVAYGIDRNAGGILADVDIVYPEDDLDEVDAVVVTAVTCFDEIEKKLREKLSCDILSLEDIVFQL